MNPILPELIGTYDQSCPWTSVLPQFYRMHSKLLYVYKDYVYLSDTPASLLPRPHSIELGEDLFGGARAVKAPYVKAIKRV